VYSESLLTMESSAEEPRLSAAASVPARLTAFLALLYLALGVLALHPWAVHWATGALLSVALFIFLPMAMVYHGVRIPLSVWGELVGFVVGTAVWVVVGTVPPTQDPSLVVPGRNLALLVAALFAGMLISRIVRERNILLPVCIAAALVDVVSVGWGFTGHVVSTAPDVVTRFSVALPQISAGARGPERAAALATMGVGDLVFLAVFLAAANRLGLNVRRAFWCVYPLALLAMLATLTIQSLPGIPALPFIALGFLVCNFRAFDLSDDERRSMLIAALLLGAIVGVYFLVRLALQ